MAKIARLRPDLKADHAGLVLFDVLEGFLHPEDTAKATFLKERNILPNLQRLLAAARAHGLTTFYPAGAHAVGGADAVERLTDTDMELRPLNDAAPIRPAFHRDQNASRIAAELAPTPGDVVVPKQRWNSFHQTNLDLQLRARGIDTIIIAGGSTDVGIASTVFSARDRDYAIVVVRDACYSTRGPNNDFFMERVFPRMARVMTVAEAAARMA
jgi:nicotinamidase-related amidase